MSIQLLLRSLLKTAKRFTPGNIMADLSQLHKTDQQSWEDRWTKNSIPFDKGEPHKALVNLLSRCGSDGVPQIPTQGLALVPGCGRGYDVGLLAQHGLDTTGIEVSAKAAESATLWLQSQEKGSGQAKVELGDFFQWTRPKGGYQVMYDYTFLCALPPSLRKEWAASYANLSAENGLLITLQFPLDGDRKTGPPYSLSEELYHELLDGCWTKIWEKAVPLEESRASATDYLGCYKENRERLVVWKRR